MCLQKSDDSKPCYLSSEKYLQIIHHAEYGVYIRMMNPLECGSEFICCRTSVRNISDNRRL